MNVEIFITTCKRDADWFRYAIQSVTKFATGFSGVTIACPDQDQDLFKEILKPHRARLVTHPDAPAPRQYMMRLVVASRADEFCPEADVIVNMDSDCFFIRAVSPKDYMEDGKPLMLIEEYEVIEAKRPFPWRQVVEAVLKRPAKYETMRRQPLVYVRGIYPFCRSEVERINGMKFDDFVLSRHPYFPHGYAEHNVMGELILNSEWRHKFSILDVGLNPWPTNPMLQFWSHGQMGSEQEVWVEGRPARMIPLQVMESILRQ